MIKTGKVSSINRKDGTVQVIFADQDDMVSHDLPMLDHIYNMPDPDDQVLCLFADNASQQGFCLGRFYCDAVPAPNKEVVRWRAEKAKDDSYVDWDIVTGNLDVINAKADITVSAQGKVIIKKAAAVEIKTEGAMTIAAGGEVNLTCPALKVTGPAEITGAVKISGGLDVSGSIHASGSIIDDGGNTNHHGH